MKTITTIESIEDLQHLVLAGETDWEKYGEVSAKEKDELILFNYTVGATLARRWNWFERNARGLIINKRTGEVVARPFEKVFNWGETYENVKLPTNADVVRISEKMDGSLGILYRYEGRFSIATRGSFDSEQAQWATDWLHKKHFFGNEVLKLPHDVTLLFEIIYPENRIVVDYYGKSMLVLLAARNRFTGEYYDQKFLNEVAWRFNFLYPELYQLGNDPSRIAEEVKTWGHNEEGVVVEFSDGSRWKFKSEAYVKVHRLLSTLSFKRILEAVKEGTIDDTLPLLPSHIRESVFKTLDEIAAIRHKIRERVLHVFCQRPTSEVRKDFALWVMNEHKDIAPYLFTLYDGRDIEREIFKLAFKNYVPQSDLPVVEED